MGRPSREHGLTIDPTISLASVQHLIADVDISRRAQKKTGITKPRLFRKSQKSRQLKALQSAEVWKDGKRDEQVLQMERWFPSVPKTMTSSPAASSRRGTLTKTESGISMQTLSINHTPPPVSYKIGCPTSDIGKYFCRLPGELRNRIYRMAVVEENQIVQVKTKPETCSQGACIHSKTSSNVPGIANTCRQMRWELMPIYCAENTVFAFDSGVVLNSCVGNYLRSLGDYADLIRNFELSLKRPLWNRDSFTEYATYTFNLLPPKHQYANGQWAMLQDEPEGRVICDCGPRELLVDLDDEKDVGKQVVSFVESEEWADFVWRVRKTKQWHNHLARCKNCGEVLFNN